MPIAAQEITADGTTSTTVTSPDSNNFTIDGGDRPEGGANLFHSFQDFSVPTGGSAFFNNPNEIVNIFSRVTGGQISSIDGLIRASGSANLFLINPAGIIFGQNARLDLGGSFLGSTADSILFPEDVSFSATNLQPPILTINAPIGLGIRDNPGDITVQGISTISELIAPENSLRVDSEQNFVLVGGNIDLEAGKIFAPGGRVELGGLSTAGEIAINADGSLNFPEGRERADVRLTDFASVNVTAAGGGFINVNAKNLILSGQSELFAGIAENMGSAAAQAGDITLNATESIQLKGSGDNTFDTEVDDLDTAIRNHVGLPPQMASNDLNIESPRNRMPESTAQGNAGSIIVQTDLLEIRARAALTSKIYGQGNTGNIIVTVNKIILDGGDLLNQVREGGRGNAGHINVETESLSAQNLSFILSDISGVGNGGSITINASEQVSIDGGNLNVSIGEGAEGTGGDLEINTSNFSLKGGSFLSADTRGDGNAGNVIINATETLILEDARIFNRVRRKAEGNAGNIVVNTSSLFLQDDSQILANTRGDGNAGNIVINTDILSLTNGAQIRSDTASNENAGNIIIETQKLTISDGAQIGVGTSAQGSAGNLIVTASNSIELVGQSEERRSGLVANAVKGSGSGGNLIVDTDELTIKDRATINVGNFQTLGLAEPGTGQAGELTINASSIRLDNNATIDAITRAGIGGNIKLIIEDNLQLSDHSTISAQAFENANGGNVTIDAEFIIAPPNQNNDIIARAERGRGGNINITAEGVFGLEERSSTPTNETNDIDASSEFGLDGTVVINTPDVSVFRETLEAPEILTLQPLGINACSGVGATGASSFNIIGKGGVPPEPTAPLSSDPIFIEGESVSINREQTEIGQREPIKPLITAQGEIYPARGIIFQENGDIILTAYPTDNVQRTPHSSPNCGASRSSEPIRL